MSAVIEKSDKVIDLIMIDNTTETCSEHVADTIFQFCNKKQKSM
jgi:hypothetical protein